MVELYNYVSSRLPKLYDDLDKFYSEFLLSCIVSIVYKHLANVDNNKS